MNLRYVSLLRIAPTDCIILENETSAHELVMPTVEALHELQPWFINKFLVGFIQRVILSAECECFGENYIT